MMARFLAPIARNDEIFNPLKLWYNEADFRAAGESKERRNRRWQKAAYSIPSREIVDSIV